MVTQSHGFTLIEAMIVVLLLGVLAVVAIPYTLSWFDESRVQQAANMVESGFGRARSLALRNPDSRSRMGNQAAARLVLDAGFVLVCSKDAIQCKVPDLDAGEVDNSVWKSALPKGVEVSLRLGDHETNTIEFNNAGQTISTGTGLGMSPRFVASARGRCYASWGGGC